MEIAIAERKTMKLKNQKTITWCCLFWNITIEMRPQRPDTFGLYGATEYLEQRLRKLHRFWKFITMLTVSSWDFLLRKYKVRPWNSLNQPHWLLYHKVIVLKRFYPQNSVRGGGFIVLCLSLWSHTHKWLHCQKLVDSNSTNCFFIYQNWVDLERYFVTKC